MRISRLRHKIRIERLQSTQNPSTGSITKKWVTFAITWAEIVPLSAKEFMNSQAMQSKITGRITIRFMRGLNAEMRIRHGRQIFNIEGILPDNKTGQEWLTIPYSEGVNDG